MATLETQYKNYLDTNPDPVMSFEEWKKDFSEKLKSDIEKLEHDYPEIEGTINLSKDIIKKRKMENYKKVLIFVMGFLTTFISSIILAEFASHLLTQQNTIANIFGYVIYILIFVSILILGSTVIKSLNK